MTLERWLIIPDTHVPYHDRRAFKLAVESAVKLGIKNVALLGDFADFYAVSSHPKSPGRKADLQWEIDETNLALDYLDKKFRGKKKYVMGNHEWRLARYLGDKAPALALRDMTVEGQFRLKDRGWESTPYKSDTKIGKLYLTHDTGRAGKYAHYAAQATYQGNVVIGHTHRLAWAVSGNARGKPHVTAQLGWLGDAKACDYMYRVVAATEWALGFGILYVEPNGHVHLTPVPIVNYKCLIEGKLFKG